MKQKHNYFVLEKPSYDFSHFGLTLLKFPYLSIKWLISFVLARNIAHLALGPDFTKKQSDFNLVHFADKSEENDDAVVINLFPHESFKFLQDHLLKLSSSWFPIPFFNLTEKKQLHYENAQDRAYIDNLLNELEKVLQGESQRDKFRGKTFDWSKIHFKGLGGLDDKMRAYFYIKLERKFGDLASSTPKKHNLNFYSLETEDYSVLDSVEVIGQGEEDKPIAERKFIIACMANKQNYIHWLKDFNHSANRIGCTVIGFNYSGVDYSTGMVWSEENMKANIKAQVERLLLLGAKPENIGLEGMCLGGAIATVTAADLHEHGLNKKGQENKGLKVKLYNERSFRTIARFITGFIFPEDHEDPWTAVNILRRIGGFVVYFITAPFIWIADWHVGADDAWDKIPAEHKSFSQIHRDADDDNEDPLLDGVVHDTWASIASHVAEKKAMLQAKPKEELTADELALLEEPLTNHNFHIAPGVDYRTPHVVARRHLIHTDPEGQAQSFTLHEHMIDSFTKMFGQNEPTKQVEIEPSTSVAPFPTEPVLRRPLAVASSGGGGHISAMQGIIDNLRTDPTVSLDLKQHRARLYSQARPSLTNGLLRLGIYISSI